MRHRYRHRAQAFRIHRLVRPDLLVRGVVDDVVEIARGELEGLEHLLRVFVHDRQIAAQAVAGIVEVLVVGNRGGHGVERDRKHD